MCIVPADGTGQRIYLCAHLRLLAPTLLPSHQVSRALMASNETQGEWARRLATTSAHWDASARFIRLPSQSGLYLRISPATA